MKQTRYNFKDYKESKNMFYWILQALWCIVWQKQGERMEEIFWRGSQL